MIETAAFTLPGGMLDPSGERHRDGRLRPFTGADEDWLHALAPATRHAGLVTDLLARCVTSIGPYSVTTEAIRELSVGDRDYLVLKLREATFGPKLSRVLTCPHPGCGAKMDLDLVVADFAVDERPTLPSHRLRLANEVGEAGDIAVDVEFRVPRGHDQEMIAAAPLAPVEVLRDRLLGACVVRATRVDDGTALAFTALSERGKQALAEAIEQAAPRVELELELMCPDCARPFARWFDPTSILLDEIRGSQAAFERELHLLALHYHWSLGELLTLTRQRRRRFLRLLADELGACRTSLT